jgi:hypothetical protein
MTVYIADTDAHVRRLVSTVKMATLLEECTSELQCLSAKGLSVKDIHKEIFSVFDRKCLSPKAVYNLV